MAGILRGDICWAHLPVGKGREIRGTRPVLVISHDEFNKASGTIIVIPITGKKPRVGFPLVVSLHQVGLPKPSWAKVSQIRTISSRRLGKCIARAELELVTRIVDALKALIE